MDICYEGILTYTSIPEPLCLGDKPIVESVEHLNKGYGPTYTGALAFSKMKSQIRIYAFMNPTPQRKNFDYFYVNEPNTVTTICLYETLVQFIFILSLLISLKLLFQESIWFT